MKNKIFALVLALVTVFYACPVYTIPAEAQTDVSGDGAESTNQTVNEPEIITPSDMEAGKLYSAFFIGNEENVHIYKDGSATTAYSESVPKSKLPTVLTVKLENENDKCAKVLNSDWPFDYEGYRYLSFNDITIVKCMETSEGYILGKVDISGEELADNKVTLSGKEGALVIATPDSDIKKNSRYQWQVKTGEDSWAVISGFIQSYATLTIPLLKNVMGGGFATVRCVVTNNEVKYVSHEIFVTIESKVENAIEPNVLLNGEGGGEPSVEPIDAVEPIDSSTSDAFHVVVKYEFRHATPSKYHIEQNLDGSTAANTFTVTLPTGGSYSGTVASPAEVGYLPYVKKDDLVNFKITEGTSSGELKYDGVEYVLANSIEFTDITKEIEVTVYYIPQIVNYVVKIYEQDLYDDNYTLATTETRSGFANAAVSADLIKKKVGFSEETVAYDVETPINEDGSTVIELYYDRIYYLVEFEETFEGKENGAMAFMTRYDTPVMLPFPSAKGYDFVDWSLVKVYDVQGSEKVDVVGHSYAQRINAGVPLNVTHNLVYKSNWQESSTIYTVIYWLENAESTDSQNKANYNVWYTRKMNAKTGDKTIAGADNIRNHILTSNGYTQNEVNDVDATYPYLIYQGGLTDTSPKEIIGDGTTTVNIYYSRKSYTLKFYYAIEKVANNNKSSYYIIGGSTYYFGSYASGNAQTDEKAAMRQYASGGSTSQTGQVQSLPTLNAKGKARNYTVSSDTDGSNKYHYISFNAKYGADISNLWPCDVFNSATRTTANTHGQWSGTEAFVSAWNGEYRVKYTQDETVNNYNQTIKGNYTQLDSNLLWEDTKINEDVVTYACFWENGANINWSVPELYRYNIYLPLLPNQNTDGLTLKTYNGTTYYLADRYKTCDDSSTAAQTQPALVGFTANGRTWETIPTSDPDFDTRLYKEAYDMYYFYSRNIYHLSFNDMHGNIVTVTIPYGTPIVSNESEHDHTPNYPSDFEEGEAVFENWYLDETHSVIFNHSMTMPAKNIQLYAYWKTVEYTVNVYFDIYDENTPGNPKDLIAGGYPMTVPFGTFVIEPLHETWQKEHSYVITEENADQYKDLKNYKDLIFIGWYYKSDDDEIRFDFNTMMVKSDMVIYAKWTKKELVDITINYIAYDGGNRIIVAPSQTLSAKIGTSKFFMAKVGEELNVGYKTGYFPEMRSHTVVAKEGASNVYDFVYTKTEEIKYTVTHVFKNSAFTGIIGKDQLTVEFDHEIAGEDLVHTAASVHILFKEGINVNALMRIYNQDTANDLWDVIKTLSPDCYEQEIILTANTPNSATFNWENHGTTASYQIIHYFEDLNGEFIPDLDTPLTGVANIGDKITATQRKVEGFNCITKDQALTGEVVSVFDSSGNLGDGLVIRVYYKRNVYSYQIHHYKVSTTVKVADSVTNLKAKHGAVIKIADVCYDIPGYFITNAKDGEGNDTQVIVTKDGTEIICYYQGLEAHYRYQVEGSDGAYLTPPAKDTFNVGTAPGLAVYTLKNDGYFFKAWYYTVGDGERQAVPDGWITYDHTEMIATVQPGEVLPEYAGKTVTIYAEILPTTRKFAVSGIPSDSKDQAFVFSIDRILEAGDDASDKVDVTFVIFGNDYLNVAMLPHGKYTITVLGWSWRYGAPTLTFGGKTYTSETGEFEVDLTGTGDVIFSYANVTPNDKWLSDDIAGYLHFGTAHLTQ